MVLFPTKVLGVGVDVVLGPHDVTRDGPFLINTVLDVARGPITLLQHWQPEVKPR